jgi:phosphonate transport system permease protein
LLFSTALSWWEFNIRASTVLGVVGAGGIGQELKNSMDLLDFFKAFDNCRRHPILDWFSGWLRKKLV